MKFRCMALLALLCFSPAWADFDRTDFELLPDFSWACHDEQIKEVISASLMPSIVLIDCALLSEELEKWDRGEEISMQEYYSVTTTSEEYDTFDKKALFKGFKEGFAEQVALLASENSELLAQGYENVNSKLKDMVGDEIVLSNNGVTPLGVLLDEENIYTYGMLIGTAIENETSTEQYHQVAVVTLFLKNDDIFLLYYYRDFFGQNDIDSAKGSVTSWLAKNR